MFRLFFLRLPPHLVLVSRLLLGASLFAGGFAQGAVVINEVVASSNERLLQWDADGVPRLGTGPAWYEQAYNDKAWKGAAAPVGYGVSGVVTNLSGEMGDAYSLYLRQAFTRPGGLAANTRLFLHIRYSDGFVAYLNGKEIGRQAMGAPNLFAAYDSYAQRRQTTEVTLDVGTVGEWLHNGENLLALQVHSHADNLNALFLRAELRAGSGGSGPSLVAPDSTWQFFPGVMEPSGGLFDPTQHDQEFEDWIELHNTGAANVNLGGWSLTDKRNTNNLWTFPAGTNLPAGGYLLVLASSRNLTSAVHSYLHTDFSLSSDGEQVTLRDQTGGIVDQVTFGPQDYFYSFGRDENGDWGYLANVTPGTANRGIALSGTVLAKPAMHPKAGFYDEPVHVTLSTPEAGANIRYTTDGSEPTATNGLSYTAPLLIEKSTTLRARAFRADSVASSTTTATYLFESREALRTIPAMVLAGHPTRSLYAPHGIMARNGGNFSGGWSAETAGDYNLPFFRGSAYERPGSFELLYANGRPSVQSDAGLRISSSIASRPGLQINQSPGQPFDLRSSSQKPSFNIWFRPRFSGDLEHDFLPDDTVERFRYIRLRAGKNDIEYPFVTDELVRRIFKNMGQHSSRGIFHTLYINGVYKGYYNAVERLKERFFQDYYGSSNEWDVIKGIAPSQTSGNLWRLEDGDLQDWEAFMAFIANNNLANAANYATAQEWMDMTNFVDYILLNIWVITLDWHMNNWVAARERDNPSAQWRFFVWDAEWSFNLQGWAPPSSDRNYFRNWLIEDTNMPPLTLLFSRLRANPDFRMLMADRAHFHLSHRGALTNERLRSEVEDVAGAMRPALVEFFSSRDIANGETFFHAFIDGRTRTGVLPPQGGGDRSAHPPRTETFLPHLAELGMWPSTLPPMLSHAAPIPPTATVEIENPNSGSSTVYYTLNGQDPRGSAGTIQGQPYNRSIAVKPGDHIQARILKDNIWSALTDVTFHLDLRPLQPTEIHFAPRNGNGDYTPETAFIELTNTADHTLDLSGAKLTDGIRYSFPVFGASVAPGEQIVLVADASAFAAAYPGVHVEGVFEYDLGRYGDRIELRDAAGNRIWWLRYAVTDGWPQKAAREGHSLVLQSPQTHPDLADPASWAAHALKGGAPGGENTMGSALERFLNAHFPHRVEDEWGFYTTSWFGRISTEFFPWVWHDEHRFLYFPEGGSIEGAWIFDPLINTWLWTSAVVHPVFYDANGERWLSYSEGSTLPRWFWDFELGLWLEL